MASSITNLRQVRLKKLEAIRKAGIDPYPAKFERRQTCFQATKLVGKKVKIAGRLLSFRGHGAITFADLVDETGKIQVCFKKEQLGTDKYKIVDLLDIGDFLGVTGEVFKTQAGEITVLVEDYQILTKALRPLPEKWHGLVDVETKLRKRYLDLLCNPEVKEMFRKKEVFWSTVRNLLKKSGFMEVETPVLEPIPGGADAKPFTTHHNALDIDLYLRISLELPLKRLLVGGFEKVFEIGRVFRNEGIDAEHLQDYTQLEFYWAYADYNDLMDFLEGFYQKVVETTTGSLKTTRGGKEIDWSGKWPCLDYSELFKEETGIDLTKTSKEELEKKARGLKIPLDENLGEGRVIDLIYKKNVRPKIIKPSFLINLPVEVSPLAKRIPEKPELTQRLLVMAGGTELGNGFSELNDPLDQAERFFKQQKMREAGDEEAQMYDKDFVEALEYGMPPTAGFGWSERVFAFLMDKPIRETVLFPLMRPNEGKIG